MTSTMSLVTRALQNLGINDRSAMGTLLRKLSTGAPGAPYTPSTSSDWATTNPTTVQSGLDKLARSVNRTIVLSGAKLADDALAADATSITFLAAVPVMANDWTVTSAYFVPTANMTADAADYATLQLFRINPVAATALSIASYQSDLAGGNLVQNTRKDMQASAAVFPANTNSLIGYTITKTGAGVVVPGGLFVVNGTTKV